MNKPLTNFHPVPKPQPRKRSGYRRRNSTLSSKKGLKRKIHPVPDEVKRKALEKSVLCFAGHCPVCGGLPVTIYDDPHHYPHKSRGGRDIPKHIWIARRLCHSYIHDHPAVEREMFRKIEAAGFVVDWKGEYGRR